MCTQPPKPENGDHFLVYGPNDVLIALQYLCHHPYELSGNSQRTCLPNSTWSGSPPVCSRGMTLYWGHITAIKPNLTDELAEMASQGHTVFLLLKMNQRTSQAPAVTCRLFTKRIYIQVLTDTSLTIPPLCSATAVNNTLTEPEKKGEGNKGKEADKRDDQDISRAEENGPEGTAGGKKEDATAFDREDKHTATEETVSGGRNNGESDGETTGGGVHQVGGRGPDDDVNTVEETQPKVVVEPPKRDPSSQDVKPEMNITETHISKDKGQEEKLRKEEQVNGKKESDKVGPNDTKLRAAVSEEENTADVLKQDAAGNRTVVQNTKRTQTHNKSAGSTGREDMDLTRLNVTQYTLYRAGGGASQTKNEEQEATEEEQTTLRRQAEEEKKKEEERETNLSFAGE